MKRARSIAVAGATAALMLLTVPARADVTITETTGGKVMGPAPVAGTKVTRIKGHKMRQDTTQGETMNTSMIFDIDGGKIIILNHKTREATVRSTADFGQAMAKIGDGDVKSSLTPTGATKTIAGQSCTEYTANVAVTFTMMENQPPLTMTMNGPVCLSKTAPGSADFKAYNEAAVQKGFFSADPATAKAQPGLAKAMTTMMEKMGDAGLPLSSNMEMSFEGTGMVAEMMKKMGKMSVTSEATKIDTATIGDDAFGVPAGYTTKTAK